MAGLLEFIGETRGKLQGYRDTTRARILQPVLDQIAQAEQSRAMNQNQQAYGKAAAALGLNTPDVGFLALLARADPTAASGLLSQAAQSRTPLGQQQLDNAKLAGQTQRFSNLLAGVGEQRAAAQEGRAVTRDSLLNQLTQLQITGQQQANAAADVLQANGGRPIPPGYIGAVIEQGNLANGAREAGAAARTLANIWEQAGTLDPIAHPEIKGTATYAAMGTVPILQQILSSGTLNEGEMEAFKGLIGDLSDPISAWQRISRRDPQVISLLRALAMRSDRNLEAIARSPVGPYINPETLTPMRAGWEPPPGTVPLDMPATPEGQFQNSGGGVDPAAGRNALGETLGRGILGLPGALAEGFRRMGP